MGRGGNRTAADPFPNRDNKVLFMFAGKDAESINEDIKSSRGLLKYGVRSSRLVAVSDLSIDVCIDRGKIQAISYIYISSVGLGGRAAFPDPLLKGPLKPISV